MGDESSDIEKQGMCWSRIALGWSRIALGLVRDGRSGITRNCL